MIKVSRKINWVSSVKPNGAIDELSKAMLEFYSLDNSYFSEIDFTANNWISQTLYSNKRIVDLACESHTVCELGCGKANILKHFPSVCSKYTGLDFSKKIMEQNAVTYPAAKFYAFESPEVFPVSNEQFDLVFCVFVLEHVTRPAKFLDECKRILKPGGKLVILCPDYLGRQRMTSQRSGFSSGTAKAKLKKNKFIDAIVTLFDNRIRIPFICRRYAKVAAQTPLFLINCSPIMFADNFFPDADAVYVTYKKEIVQYLSDGFKEIENTAEIVEIEKSQKAIFLEFQKK